MGRTTHPMPLLLYCIRYPVKPFLASSSRFLLSAIPLFRLRPPAHSISAQGSIGVLRTHAFSRAPITGRIRADSEKLDSRDQQPFSTSQERPHRAHRCARANGRVISRRSDRFLRMLVACSAILSRQAAISDQAAHRRARRILQRRRSAPNWNRPNAPRPLPRSHSASPRSSRTRLQ